MVFFLDRELTARSTHVDPDKTVSLTPKEHVLTPQYISLCVGRGVRIADEGRMQVVGVPVVNNEFAIESAIGIVRDGGA